MRKLNALIAFLTFMCLVAKAQVPPTIDVVVTDRGTWRGTITEITEDSVYIMKTLSGLVLRIPDKSVVSITQEWYRQRKPREYKFREKGFYQAVELGLSANGTGVGMGLTYAAGHRFSRLLGVGGGTGLEGYQLGWGMNVIPLFGEVRGFLLGKKISPYYSVRAGYGFALRNRNFDITAAEGGWLLNPTVGVRFGGGSAVSYYMGVGVHFQKASFTTSEWWSEGETTDNYMFRRIELKFGITF